MEKKKYSVRESLMLGWDTVKQSVAFLTAVLAAGVMAYSVSPEWGLLEKFPHVFGMLCITGLIIILSLDDLLPSFRAMYRVIANPAVYMGIVLLAFCGFVLTII